MGTEVFYHGGAAYTGHTLQDALEQQYSGMYRSTHYGASGYNEVILSSLFWEYNLPWAVEAFFYASDPSMQATQRDQIRRAHNDFILFYGLSAEEVPLLEYVCYSPPLDPVHHVGPCFVDVSRK